MSTPLRTRMIEATVSHIQGKIAYHKANLEVYLLNPAGIGEHSDIMESFENELKQIAEYQDMLEVAFQIPPE
jgi:ABC-type antimicrobial peptide transport system ATPase subunit